ncbi:hypothetical protein [Rhodoferax sp.]|uniref:hypothetical protein n=1 Tax=Rhodoferax sp. TaxID=50421 RepID=UPI00374D882F
MSVSSVSATTPVAATPKSGSATSAATSTKDASKDTTAAAKAAPAPAPAVAAPSTNFNVSMPTQPISNGLGQTIGQHINLRA